MTIGWTGRKIRYSLDKLSTVGYVYNSQAAVIKNYLGFIAVRSGHSAWSLNSARQNCTLYHSDQCNKRYNIEVQRCWQLCSTSAAYDGADVN